MLNFKLFVKADQEDPKDVLAAVDAAASQLPPAAAAPPAAAPPAAVPPDPSLAPPAAPAVDPVKDLENKLMAIVDKDSSTSAKDKVLNEEVIDEGVVETGVMSAG